MLSKFYAHETNRISDHKIIRQHTQNEKFRRETAEKLGKEMDDKDVEKAVKIFAKHEDEGDNEHSNYQIRGPPMKLAKYPCFYCDMHAAANEGKDWLDNVWVFCVHLTESPTRASLFGSRPECHDHTDAPTRKLIQGKLRRKKDMKWLPREALELSRRQAGAFLNRIAAEITYQITGDAMALLELQSGRVPGDAHI